jgi:hypothetical protein
MSEQTEQSAETDAWDLAMTLISLASEDGQIDVQRLTARPPGSFSRRAYELCRSERWIAGNGMITPKGFDELAAWRSDPSVA